MLDKIKYKETSTKYAILFVGNTTKGGIIMLKFQDNNTTVIATFEDFILTAYVIIDELYHQFAPPEVTRRRHILNAKLSDSEIITISLCGELAGVDSENAWFSFVKRNYRHLFRSFAAEVVLTERDAPDADNRIVTTKNDFRIPNSSQFLLHRR